MQIAIGGARGGGKVSPITIRLRILKDGETGIDERSLTSFTHHDPLEDTESEVEVKGRIYGNKFHPSRSA